jgi:hypothetical protein
MRVIIWPLFGFVEVHGIEDDAAFRRGFRDEFVGSERRIGGFGRQAWQQEKAEQRQSAFHEVSPSCARAYLACAPVTTV